MRVRYRTRGLELLYYQVPQRRNIRDFRLAIDVSGLAVDDVNYPDFCLTPTAIEPTESVSGSAPRSFLSSTIARSATMRAKRPFSASGSGWITGGWSRA